MGCRYDEFGNPMTAKPILTATAETTNPKTNQIQTFSGYGATYDEAKASVVDVVKSYFDNITPPDPEIVEI